VRRIDAEEVAVGRSFMGAIAAFQRSEQRGLVNR
jgi:hypothetical protein